jgi:hypothetical protein
MGVLALVRLARVMKVGEYPGSIDLLVINRQGAKYDGAIGKFRYVLVRYHSTRAGSELSELTVGCGEGSLPSSQC